jgi:hypothetical protein
VPTGTTLDGLLLSAGSTSMGASGTLAVASTPATYADGTLSIDRHVFLAFYSRVRLTRPDVTVNGELIPQVVDVVTIDDTLADPIRYAAFALATKRVAYHDPASLSRESLPVQIDLWCGPPGTVMKWTAFHGTTETSQNSQPYRPRGSFRAVSDSATWANTKGCINLPAFSGLTRGAIIALFADSAGVTISNVGDLGGGVVNKPVDKAGMTVFELINQYGEVEGWIARATEDGKGLEVLDEDQFLEGSPIFVFDESNYFDTPQNLPNRPVTNWVLSTTEINNPVSDSGDPGSDSEMVTTTTAVGGVNGTGGQTLVVTEITTNLGVEIRRVVTSWDTVPTPGVTATGPSFQIVSRVNTSQVWAPFTYEDADGTPHTRPSTMLTERHVTTELLTGIPAAVSGYTWVQGGSYSQPYAQLLQVQTQDYRYTWGDCFLTFSDSVTMGYYSPLNSVDNSYGGPWTYSDGSKRLHPNYIWLTIFTDRSDWTDLSADAQPRVEQKLSISKWYLTSPGVESFGPYSVTTKTYSAGSNNSYAIAESTVDSDGQSSGSTLTGSTGSMPGIPTGSSTVPQFSQTVVMEDFDATAASGYTKRTESPGTMDYAESVTDLIQIALRRIRRECAVELAVSHNAVPFLRVGDHVQITNHARSLVSADAYVWAISRTAAPLNGAMRQTTTLRIPPDWI